jgi:hypothetical protein
MTRRIVSGVILMCLTLVATTVAHERFRFVGSVVKMDRTKNVLTMKTIENKKELVLQIAIKAKTAIDRNGKKAAAAELKPGLSIVVDALGDDYDDLEAEAVKIVPPPTK